MARVLLTHTPDMLRNYYGDKALAALERHAEVRINPGGKVLDAEALARAARYRQGRVPDARPGRQLEGAALGIIGYGVIGQTLAPIGRALGMQVLVSDPHKTITAPGIRQVELDTLLAQSDFVVCLAVATE